MPTRSSRFLQEVEPGWGQPDVIGFHGQTVLHRPAQALTVQLGDGALLAKATGMPVVYDMRANDMAHGGQGAPLVPAYHAALARSLPGRACGQASGRASSTSAAFPTSPMFRRKAIRSPSTAGPGNTLIDQWVVREGGVPFDAGRRDRQRRRRCPQGGRCYLDNPFFLRSGPKSLDRNDFTLDLAEGLELSDGARTLAAVSARAILKSAEHVSEQPKLWIVCGGGRKNPHIVGDLRDGCQERAARSILAEDVGLNGDSTEAEAWAYLAVRSLRGLPLTFPTTTGCREAVTGGVLANVPPAG